MPHYKQTLFWAFVLLFFTASAQAAVIYLKDGGQVRGTVVSATARDIQVHTAEGIQDISTDRIARIDYADTAAPQETPAPSSVAPPAPVPIMMAPPPYRRVLLEPPAENLRQMFSLGFGLAAPLSRVDFSSTGGGSDSNGDAGVLLGAHYHYSLTPRLAVGASSEWFHRGAYGSRSLLPDSETDVSGNTVLLLGTLKLSLIDRGPVRPYVLGGLGGNRTSTAIDATPRRGFGWSDTGTSETRTLVDESHWGFASSLRFGVDFALYGPSFFTIEAGWTRLANASYSATAAGQDLGLNSVTGNQDILLVSARWGWRF